MKVQSSPSPVVAVPAAPAGHGARPAPESSRPVPQAPPVPDVQVDVKPVPAPHPSAGGVVGDKQFAIIKLVVQAITGEPVEIAAPTSGGDSVSGEWPALTTIAPLNAAVARAYDRTAPVPSANSSTFGASGTVRTADGANVAFKLAGSVVRNYDSSAAQAMRWSGQSAVPVSVNYAGTAASLQDTVTDFGLPGGTGTAWIAFSPAG